ncbi:hypothetical protein AKO1_006519 [Acrasis kona]|uniref:Uncharacterized protein n=1 Tax=Acrasis kona TaxID=1008807 RepID=A0AAW2ZKH3_9EUKA
MNTTRVLLLLLVCFSFVFAVLNTADEPDPDADTLAKDLSGAVVGYASDFRKVREKVKGDLNSESSKFEKLASLITKKDPESLQVKKGLQDISKKLKLMSKNTGRSILTYSVKENLSDSDQSNEPQSDWIPILDEVVDVLKGTADFVNDVGTYHKRITKLGNWVGEEVSPWLKEQGLEKISELATDLSKDIHKTSKEIADKEKELAKKLKPIKKNKVFQAARKTITTVQSVLSITSIAEDLYDGFKDMIDGEAPEDLEAFTKSSYLIARKGVSGYKQYAGFRRVNGKYEYYSKPKTIMKSASRYNNGKTVSQSKTLRQRAKAARNNIKLNAVARKAAKAQEANKN